MNVYIGIDPGKSGSICSVDSDGNAKVIIKTDRTYRDIWDELWYASLDGNCKAVIEKVHAMPNQGVVSTFSFGESFGLLLGLLTAAGVPFEKVRPSVWCKEFGLKREKDESNTDWKNRHKQLAQQLFPDIDVIHATADALLIAEYCRRKNI